MIENVLIDLDDTILDFQKSERVALSETFDRLGLTPTDEILDRYHVINREQWELLERGKITRSQVLERRFTLLFEEYHLKVPSKEVQALYEELLGNMHFFVEGAWELLENLSASYTLHLVTNGTSHIQRRRLQHAGILPFFSNIFISHEIGFNKPDPRYFEFCFSHIPNFQKETAVIVGDSLSSDIRGGNSVGVKTCWFNPTHNHTDGIATPDHEFDSLYALPPLLQQL